jgi:RNA polymerase sigma-70 factor (ECF subfamily)
MRLRLFDATIESSMDSTLPWEELQGRLHVFIRRRVRNAADVDDLVQRVLLQLIKGHQALRDKDRLLAWVYQTARRTVVDYYRAPVRRREVTGVDASPINTPADTWVEADDQAALAELAGCLAPMLQQLPPSHREAITLVEIEGLSQGDAARRAGVSLSGMKSRVQRGRRQLRQAFEACCRIELDRRGGVVSYEARPAASCETTQGSCQPAEPALLQINRSPRHDRQIQEVPPVRPTHRAPAVGTGRIP